MEFFKLPSIISKLDSPFLQAHEIELSLKRDDLIHAAVSGNKWRKLKYNLLEAQKKGIKQLITFGGAYSNHIAATASAGNLLGIKTIGVIRGEEGFENETLLLAQKNGMKLHFVSRTDYRQKNELDFRAELISRFGDSLIVPEGGANALGVLGCQEILEEVNEVYDVVACSAGTGTTASGICKRLKKEKLLVFPALKGGQFILEEMKAHCTPKQIKQVELQLDYHFGGYAKTKPELIEFYFQFLKDFNIELDLVYTSKMMYGLYDLIQKQYFPRGTKILAIHTGGVQGNKGILKSKN